MNEATTPPKRRPGRRLLRIAGLLFAVVLIFDVWDRCYHPVFFGVSYLFRPGWWPNHADLPDRLAASCEAVRKQGCQVEVTIGTKDDDAYAVIKSAHAGGVREYKLREAQSSFAISSGTLFMVRVCSVASGLSVRSIDLESGSTNWTVQFGLTDHTSYFNCGYRLDASKPGRLLLDGYEMNGRHTYLLDTVRTSEKKPVFIDMRHCGETPYPWKASPSDRLSTMISVGLSRVQYWLDD